MIKTIPQNVPQNAILAAECVRKELSNNDFAISNIVICNSYQGNLITSTFSNMSDYIQSPEQNSVTSFSDQFLGCLTPTTKITKRYNKLSLNIGKYLVNTSVYNFGGLGYSYRVDHPELNGMLNHRETIFYVSDIYEKYPPYLSCIHMDTNGMIVTSFKKIKKNSTINLTVTSVNLIR